MGSFCEDQMRKHKMSIIGMSSHSFPGRLVSEGFAQGGGPVGCYGEPGAQISLLLFAPLFDGETAHHVPPNSVQIVE